jgi:hypothetical protein
MLFCIPVIRQLYDLERLTGGLLVELWSCASAVRALLYGVAWWLRESGTADFSRISSSLRHRHASQLLLVSARSLDAGVSRFGVDLRLESVGADDMGGRKYNDDVRVAEAAVAEVDSCGRSGKSRSSRSSRLSIRSRSLRGRNTPVKQL